MTQTEAVKNKLAKKAQETAIVHKPKSGLEAYLQDNKSIISQAIPKHMDADRLLRVALTTYNTTPKLKECTAASVAACVIQAAQLGLEPGLLGQCYLIPFWNKKENKMNCQFILGYKGMLDLIRRSGEVSKISCHEVYENDVFDIEFGMEDKINLHKPWFMVDPKGKSGEVIGAYAVFKMKGDDNYFVNYLPISEIEKRRDRSKSKDSGPWQTDYVPMCKKTVIRDSFKYLPVSIEINRQISTDETVPVLQTKNNEVFLEHEFIDAEFTAEEPEKETQEQKQLEKPLPSYIYNQFEELKKCKENFYSFFGKTDKPDEDLQSFYNYASQVTGKQIIEDRDFHFAEITAVNKDIEELKK